MQTQKLKLRRTISLEGIVEQTGVGWQQEDQKPKVAMEYFRRWPIDEVRAACLKVMRNSFWDLEHLDWARETTESLIEANDLSMAREVMEQYADVIHSEAERRLRDLHGFRDNAAHDMYYYGGHHGATNLWTEFVQMLIFVTRMAINPQLFGSALKIACQCMHPENFRGCYSHVELKPVHSVFMMALNRVKGKYAEEDWHRAQRVLSLIVCAGDRTYIGQVKDIIAGHEEGQASPNFVNTFFHVANMAVLKESLRLLEQVPVEAQPQSA